MRRGRRAWLGVAAVAAMMSTGPASTGAASTGTVPAVAAAGVSPPAVVGPAGPAPRRAVEEPVAAVVAPPPAPAEPVLPVVTGGSGIPEQVRAAYENAAGRSAVTDPGCGLTWELLAGIGRIESGHASGGRVDGAGTTRGLILGPRLDGSVPGVARITDTDGGALDGDVAFDRAVGPMQFIPGTWAGYAADGNDDGVRDPHNVFDATLAAARYLCAGGGDLGTAPDLAAALLRYNRSVAYGLDVQAWAQAYRTGGAPVIPAQRGPVPAEPAEPTETAALPAVADPPPAGDEPSADDVDDQGSDDQGSDDQGSDDQGSDDQGSDDGDTGDDSDTDPARQDASDPDGPAGECVLPEAAEPGAPAAVEVIVVTDPEPGSPEAAALDSLDDGELLLRVTLPEVTEGCAVTGAVLHLDLDLEPGPDPAVIEVALPGAADGAGPPPGSGAGEWALAPLLAGLPAGPLLLVVRDRAEEPSVVRVDPDGDAPRLSVTVGAA